MQSQNAPSTQWCLREASLKESSRIRIIYETSIHRRVSERTPSKAPQGRNRKNRRNSETPKHRNKVKLLRPSPHNWRIIELLVSYLLFIVAFTIETKPKFLFHVCVCLSVYPIGLPHSTVSDLIRAVIRRMEPGGCWERERETGNLIDFFPLLPWLSSSSLSLFLSLSLFIYFLLSFFPFVINFAVAATTAAAAAAAAAVVVVVVAVIFAWVMEPFLGFWGHWWRHHQ